MPQAITLKELTGEDKRYAVINLGNGVKRYSSIVGFEEPVVVGLLSKGYYTATVDVDEAGTRLFHVYSGKDCIGEIKTLGGEIIENTLNQGQER